MDFWPAMTVYQRQLWILNWVIFFVVGIPGGWIIIKPIFGL